MLRNSSGSHGGSVLRAVGDDYEPGAFSTYSPCAIALIGKVPDTLHERRSNRSQARAIERNHEPVPLRSSRTPRCPGPPGGAVVSGSCGRDRQCGPGHAERIYNRVAHPTYCAAIAACIFSAAASSEKDRHLRSSHRVLPPTSRGPDGECVSTDRAGAAN